jgi:phosphoglycerate dehydrogenase-like enzyme
MILLSRKKILSAARHYREQRAFVDRERSAADGGLAARPVGIVGASTTGRMTIELLHSYDVDIAVYDPYLPHDEARELGVRKQELDELMAACPVVSIHAPDTAETRRMIDARRLALLPDGATLINMARGALVDTEALVEQLRTRRIEAILDVTDPEPLPPDHPLWELPNVLLTPHVAGSMGNELLRLGDAAVTEVERLAAGLPPAHPEPLPSI